MTPIVTAGLIVLLQVASLDDALRAVEAGQAQRLPRSLGIQAARALDRTDPPDRTEALLAVALAGEAHEALAPALGRLLARDDAHLPAALRAVGHLPSELHRQVLRAIGGRERALRPAIVDAATGDDDHAAAGALWLLVPTAPADLVVDLIVDLGRAERHARVEAALRLAARTTAPRPLLEALIGLAPGVAPRHQPWLTDSVRELVARDAGAAAAALDLARFSPSPAALLALASAPEDLWAEAAGLVDEVLQGFVWDVDVLTSEEVELLTAAVEAAGELRLPGVRDLAPTLLAPLSPAPVRVATLRALGTAGGRDATVVDLLLERLEATGVERQAAYEALRAQTGQSLPLRPDMWRAWRGRMTLPVTTALEHAVRLERERALAYRARAREARLAALR